MHKFDFRLLINNPSNYWRPVECGRCSDKCVCFAHNPYVFFEGQRGDKRLPNHAVKDTALLVSRQQQVQRCRRTCASIIMTENVGCGRQHKKITQAFQSETGFVFGCLNKFLESGVRILLAIPPPSNVFLLFFED